MSELLNPRKVASQWSRADLRTELPAGDPAIEGQPYIEPTTGKMEVSRGRHRQVNMEAMQSLPEGRFAGYYAEHTPRINFQLPASNADDGTPTDIGNAVVHPSIVAFDRKWNGYKYWMVITPYPNSDGEKENPSIVATNDDSFSTWEQPAGVVNPVAPFVTGLAAQSDVCMVYDYERDMLVFYYLVTYTGGRQMRTCESSDGVTWTPYVNRLTYAGVEAHGSPNIVIWDDNGTMRCRLIYYRDRRMCYRDATNIYGVAGSWDAVPEIVVPCTLPRDRLLWDFQCYRLESGEWFFCQALADLFVLVTENYWGWSTDDMTTIQFDPAPKLEPTTPGGDIWANQYIYTTTLVARVVDGLLVFDSVVTGKGGNAWGGMGVRFKKRDAFATKALVATDAPAMGVPKTGPLTLARYAQASIDGLNSWTKTNSVTNSADGFVFTNAQAGWLKNTAAGTVGLTDWTAKVRFRLDQDPAAATAGARVGICNVGGIQLVAIRHASGAAWQIEIVTFVGATPTSRVITETLPGSYGEWINVAITKSGDNLIYASDTDNVLLAGTATFAYSLTNLVEIGQPAPSVTADITISEFRLWASSVSYGKLNRLARPTGLSGTVKKNLALSSEEIDAASWTKYRLNVTTNAANNPYGRLTADKIVPTAVPGTHAFEMAQAYQRGVPYLLTINAKADGYGYLALLAAGFGRYFDLSAGVALGPYYEAPWKTPPPENLGGGWWRLSIVVCTSLVGAGNAGAFVSADGVSASFTADGTSGVLIGGVQIVRNEFAPITYHRRLGA